MSIEVNYVAVLLATLSSMVVGAIWYMPQIFGKSWMKLTKVDPSKTPSNPLKIYGLTLLASFLTAYVLAHTTFIANQVIGSSYMSSAISTAFWLWLGFIASRLLVHDLFEQRPTKLTLLNAGHEFATVMIMALIIGGFGV